MTWRKPACESHACPEWQVLPDGTVRLRSSLRPLEVIEFSRDELAALVAAYQAGEVAMNDG